MMLGTHYLSDDLFRRVDIDLSGDCHLVCDLRRYEVSESRVEERMDVEGWEETG